MSSTYTLNNGIELIGTGEQSGTWGATTNTNFELLDTALDGQVTITASSAGSSGSPNSLPVSDGAASNGRNRLVNITSGTDLGATVYYQLTPSDAEKIIYIRNSLNTQSLIVFQGTYNASNDYEIPNGKTAIIFFNGGDSGAVAANVMSNAHFDALNIVGDVTIGDDLSLNSDGAIINIGADADLQITHSGSAGTITNATGDLTLDVAGDIILDADGSDFKFRDGGAGFFTISNSSLDAVLKVEQSNEDFIIKGNDGGSEITALTLDMSEAGAATFNAGVTLSGDLTVDTDTLYVDSANDRVGINNTGSAGYDLYVGNGLTGTKAFALNGQGSSSSVMNIDLLGGGTGNPSGRIAFSSSTESLSFSTGDNASITTAMTIDASQRVMIGVTTNTPVVNASLQFEVIGDTTVSGAGGIAAARFGGGSTIALGGSPRSTTTGSYVIVQDDDNLGNIFFSGDDGTDLRSVAARISADVDGTPGADDMPGRLVFYTTSSGTASTERMRISKNGYVGIGTSGDPLRRLTVKSTDGTNQVGRFESTESAAWVQFASGSTGTASRIGSPDNTTNASVAFVTADVERMRVNPDGHVLIGHTSGILHQGEHHELQVSDTNFSLASFATYRNGSDGAMLALSHSRNGTKGSQTILNADDNMGGITFFGSDGTDFARGAQIKALVDGSPANNDMPGRIIFATSSSGTDSPTERMRIDNAGRVIVNNGDVSTGIGTNKALLQVANIDTTYDWSQINTDANGYASTANEIAVLNTANQDLNGFAGIFFQAGESSNGSSINAARIGAIKTSTGGTNTDLAFACRNGSAAMTEYLRIDSFGGLTIKSLGGTTAAIFGGTNLVNGITAVPAASGTPFVLGRDTGTTRSAHFGGHLKFDSGYGIDFSATGNSSGTVGSELLSDYEHGTWLPQIAGSTTDPTVTYQQQHGEYVRVGNMLWIAFYIYVASGNASGGAGTVQIKNLPFSIQGAGNGAYNFIPAGYVHTGGASQVAQSNNTMRWQSNAHPTAVLNLYSTNNSSHGSGFYELSGTGVLQIYQ